MSNRMPNTLQRLTLAVLAACVLGLFFSGVAAAGTGGTLSLPGARAKIKNGLRVEIDSRWVDGNGYRPIRVKLIPWPPGPTTFARTIRVEIKPSLRYGGVAETDASAFIEIPEGAASVTRVICVPQNSSWANVSVRFYEEGVRLKDLDSAIGFAFAGNNQAWSEAQPTILMLDADAPKIAERDVRIAEMISERKKTGGAFTLPDVRGLIAAQPHEGFIHFKFDAEETTDDAELLQSLTKAPRLEIIPPSDMPERWIEWTNVDIIFISLADLKKMARQETQKFAVLREYISTGATLCVHGVGEKFQNLKALEQILQTRPLEGAEQEKYRAWRAPNPHTYTPDVAGIAVSANGVNSYVSPLVNATATGIQQDPRARAREIAAEAKVEKTKKRSAPDPPNFVLRSHGLGRVVAFHAENPFPGNAADWGWFYNELGNTSQRDASWMWYQRHGMSHSRNNPGFWNFLVPGVGRPPVTAFLAVISLFVILIGPLNYLLLVRTGRLYLLLVTVPLGAGVVTLSLFGFALFTDGIHVRARVRSFTQLNQQQGRAVSWSRQTYYAALRPSGGLTFPPTAAVYPLEQKPAQRYLQRSLKTMHWEENQYLTRGYIAPRLPAQFMVINSDKTPSKLVLAAGKNDAAPRVENQLSASIVHLLMRQADGRYFWAENIEPGAASQTAPMKLKPVLEKLRTIYRAHPLALPENYDAKTLNAALQYGSRNNWYARGNSDGSLPEPSPSTSLLEQNLRSVFKAKGHPLAPGEFVAVLKNSPHTPQGVDGARQEMGFHVIKGSW